jgi:phosphonate transport system permease protein
MSKLHLSEMDAIEARHPEIFARPFWSRFRMPLVVLGAILYGVYCWWFFAIGSVFHNANWSLAGTYLADWVSYEVRPEIRMTDDGVMQIVYPRFSPLGDNPNPDWLIATRETVTRRIEAPAATVAQPVVKKTATSFMTAGAPLGGSAATPTSEAKTEVRTEEIVTRAEIVMSGSTRIEVVPGEVLVRHGKETLRASIDGKTVLADGEALPGWALQKRPGEKIVLSFGMAGWAEIEPDEVSIRKRFIGWANFLFDTQSPFFGKSASEVISLIASGERIDPSRSNLSLAWSNILYNSEWQPLDVWTKLLQTIVMAFVGTVLATLIAFPLAFLAARNITRSWFSNQLTKRFFDFLRSVDMLIWALFFTRAFGPGPLAGMSAIFFTDTGTLGKLYSEALENIDDKQREGVKSVGAPGVAVQRFGVLPQVLPVFASQALYFWESNTRSATIIGAVGAGGIGLKLWEAMRTNSDWENVAYMVLLILIVVFVFDAISNALRTRLIGRMRT